MFHFTIHVPCTSPDPANRIHQDQKVSICDPTLNGAVSHYPKTPSFRSENFPTFPTSNQSGIIISSLHVQTLACVRQNRTYAKPCIRRGKLPVKIPTILGQFFPRINFQPTHWEFSAPLRRTVLYPVFGAAHTVQHNAQINRVFPQIKLSETFQMCVPGQRFVSRGNFLRDVFFQLIHKLSR